MQRFGQKTVREVNFSNKITLGESHRLLTGPAAQPVVHKLHVQETANDDLYGELEIRYGCVFAQWVVDRLPS